MWAIRILSGAMAGKVITLKEGKTRIGRGIQADVQINAAGVSKEHVEITVLGEKLLFTDLNSSNGTFLNGVRVKGGILKLGDKLGIHNIILDVIVVSERANIPVPVNRAPTQTNAVSVVNQPTFASQVAVHQPAHAQHYQVPMPQHHQSSQYAPQMQYQQPLTNENQPSAAVHETFSDKFNNQINDNIMPAFYQLSEQFEFRYILMGFVGVYVMMVTLLAIIPMKQITSDSISTESRRRAVTVARGLAKGNEKVIRSGDIANFSTEYALREEGVDDVYVVSKEGRILAPPERVGSPPKENAFFRNTVIKAGIHESSAEIDGKVGAAVPILGYDAETQQNVAKAYAVVIYNPGSLNFDDGRMFSLFIQMLALAMVAGGVLFFVLYRLIEYPYQQLNIELDSALRENREQANVKVKLPVLHNMVTNINSLLSRAANAGQAHASEAGRGSKNSEYMNILQLIGFPALLISPEGVVLKGNPAFEHLTTFKLSMIENQKVSAIPDQSMQKNIQELIQKAAAATGETHLDSLSINDVMYTFSCQAATTVSGEVDAYFFTISQMQSEGGQAA